MSGFKVMVIEANARIGALVCEQLAKKGFEAAHVPHGAAAARQLHGDRCDAILIDSKVPIGGVRTARILRLHPVYSTIPVVHLLPPDKEEARAILADAKDYGFAHFLLKPFSLEDLQRSLNQLLSGQNNRPEGLDTDRIREEIRSLSNLPAMPDVHTKLLQLLGKPDEEIDLTQVAKTMELDPALAIKVMRTCRSAFFGFKGNAMVQALTFLGVETIRMIVQSAIVSSIFSEAGVDRNATFTMRDLWRHSLATGLVMEALSKADKKRNHFMMGLLHDVGKAIFHFRFSDYFSQAVDLAQQEGIPLVKAERDLMGITHAECGGELARYWGLPEEIRTAIITHHDPATATQHRRLATMVHLADIAVRRMGIGSGGDNLIPTMDPLAKRLGISLKDVIERKDEFVEQVDGILGEEED